MSVHVGDRTPVQLTIGWLVGAVVAVLVTGIGAFWVIADFTSAGLREDVSAIRSTLSTLQGSDKDNAVNIKQTELDFTRQIGALNVSLAQFSGKIDALGAKVDVVDKSLQALSGVNVSLTQLSGKMDALGARIDVADKSMQALSGQMASFQAQVGARQEAAFDPGPLIAALKTAGYNAQVVVILPSGKAVMSEPK